MGMTLSFEAQPTPLSPSGWCSLSVGYLPGRRQGSSHHHPHLARFTPTLSSGQGQGTGGLLHCLPGLGPPEESPHHIFLPTHAPKEPSRPEPCSRLRPHGAQPHLYQVCSPGKWLGPEREAGLRTGSPAPGTGHSRAPKPPPTLPRSVGAKRIFQPLPSSGPPSAERRP